MTSLDETKTRETSITIILIEEMMVDDEFSID